MYRITSHFHQLESFRTRPHTGLDFKMEIGEPIRSIREGVVTNVVDFGKANIGKGVYVQWNDGKVAIYGHMSETSVRVGEKVEVGELLGYAGNTGFSTGSHLHFGLKENGVFIDPTPYANDIQNMNNLKQFCERVTEIVQTKVDFFQFMSKHTNSVGDTLTNLKLQLISGLSYDVLFIQILKQLSQFLSTHTSTLNHIITGIL